MPNCRIGDELLLIVCYHWSNLYIRKGFIRHGRSGKLNLFYIYFFSILFLNISNVSLLDFSLFFFEMGIEGKLLFLPFFVLLGNTAI